MTAAQFHLVAEISSDRPAAIKNVLEEFVGSAATATAGGFHVDCLMEGTDARELNRELLSALRRVERRTRVRAEWTGGGVTHRFFDYSLKSTRSASPEESDG